MITFLDYQEIVLAANYHRVWVRFRNPELKRRLSALKREMREKTSKNISNSELVEKIVEQFLDKYDPVTKLLEESS
jgi:hypothetical protein